MTDSSPSATPKASTGLRLKFCLYLALRTLSYLALPVGWTVAIAILASARESAGMDRFVVVAICVGASGLAAVVPYLVASTYGSPKEKAGSRVYMLSWWFTVLIGAVVLLVTANLGRDYEATYLVQQFSSQLVGLVLLGIVVTLISNIRIAAEAYAAPEGQTEDTPRLTVDRLHSLAASHAKIDTRGFWLVSCFLITGSWLLIAYISGWYFHDAGLVFLLPASIATATLAIAAYWSRSMTTAGNEGTPHDGQPE